MAHGHVATIHDAGCSFCNHGKGVHGTPALTLLARPYHTARSALRGQRSSAAPTVTDAQGPIIPRPIIPTIPGTLLKPHASVRLASARPPICFRRWCVKATWNSMVEVAGPITGQNTRNEQTILEQQSSVCFFVFDCQISVDRIFCVD